MARLVRRRVRLRAGSVDWRQSTRSMRGQRRGRESRQLTYSRGRVVGWALQPHLQAELGLEGLYMALGRRVPEAC